MPALAFAKNHLLYLPFPDDDLMREARQFVMNAGGKPHDQILTDSTDLAREMKYPYFWEYLWILCHGGDGSPHLYGTDGTKKGCAEVAQELVAGGLVPGIPIVLWSCFGGAAGGAAQSLWLNLCGAIPGIRVGGIKGLTGTFNEYQAAELVSRAAYDFRRGTPGGKRTSRADESIRAVAQLEDLVFYPGAPTRPFEV